MSDYKDGLPDLPADASVRRDTDPGDSTVWMAWPGTYRSHDYEIVQEAPPVGEEDDSAIAGVVQRYHSLAPQDFAASWQEVATDPYYSFQKEGVVPVNDSVIQAWTGGTELSGFLEKFPISSPRRVSLNGLQILYVGNSRAVVTYRLEEEAEDGQVLAGNGAVVVVKTGGSGWRVVALVKEERSLRAAATP